VRWTSLVNGLEESLMQQVNSFGFITENIANPLSPFARLFICVVVFAQGAQLRF
jgi:hypothetical protein